MFQPINGRKEDSAIGIPRESHLKYQESPISKKAKTKSEGRLEEVFI